MTERPILFSAPMVRALLAGTKTQTRRVVKPQPTAEGAAAWSRGFGAAPPFPCPYGLPGDSLWVRETTRAGPLPNILTGEPTNAIVGFYSADGAEVVEHAGFNLAWWYSRLVCPPIHMPRWASRITLRITDVRVERLNDISEEDALAEGVVWSERWQSFVVSGVEHPNKDFPVLSRATAREMYAALWDTINGSGAWLANPWVWAVSCERVGP